MTPAETPKTPREIADKIAQEHAHPTLYRQAALADAIEAALAARAPGGTTEAKAAEVNDRGVEAFAKAILHGDAEHQQWLLDAASAWLDEDVLPVTRSGQSSSQMTTTELQALQGLSDLSRAAWNACDMTEDAGAEDIRMERKAFESLSAALDKIDELPDDQPGYTMEAGAKAELALRRLLAASPVQPSPETGYALIQGGEGNG